jgi:hypothetical protein
MPLRFLPSNALPTILFSVKRTALYYRACSWFRGGLLKSRRASRGGDATTAALLLAGVASKQRHPTSSSFFAEKLKRVSGVLPNGRA